MVITEYLAQDFIVHGGLSLAPQRTAEQAFNRSKCRLDIRPQMIALHILSGIAFKAIIHSPEGPPTAGGVVLEGDVRSRT